MKHFIKGIKAFVSGFLSAPNKSNTDATIERVPLSGDVMDIDSLKDQEKGGGVKFDYTENSPLSKGAAKAEAKGIDSFENL